MNLIINILRTLRLIKKTPNDSYSNEFINLSDTISYNLLLRTFNNSHKIVNTQKEILFCNFSFNTSIKTIIEKQGKPRYQLKHESIPNLNMIFYRTKFANKATLLFCFFFDKLVYGSWIFDKADSATIQEIENAIYSKYLNESVLSEKPSLLSDNLGNCIELVCNVHFSINFYSSDKKILTQISNQKYKYLEEIRKLNSLEQFI